VGVIRGKVNDVVTPTHVGVIRVIRLDIRHGPCYNEHIDNNSRKESTALLSSSQAAARLGMTRGQFLYRVFRKRELRPDGRIGRHYLFDEQTLLAWQAAPPTPLRASLSMRILNAERACTYLGVDWQGLPDPDGWANDEPFWYRGTLDAIIKNRQAEGEDQ